jgi:hypothetical protein
VFVCTGAIEMATAVRMTTKTDRLGYFLGSGSHKGTRRDRVCVGRAKEWQSLSVLAKQACGATG